MLAGLSRWVIRRVPPAFSACAVPVSPIAISSRPIAAGLLLTARLIAPSRRCRAVDPTAFWRF